MSFFILPPHVFATPTFEDEMDENQQFPTEILNVDPPGKV
jgi:hypothetical protein